jgi:hypothetical protein
MVAAIRNILNILYRSAHWFDDGSRLDYLIREDVIRYCVKFPTRRTAYIPLTYDTTKRCLRVNEGALWKWRDPHVPPHMWSDWGPSLSEVEKADLLKKLRVLLVQQPRRFDPPG